MHCLRPFAVWISLPPAVCYDHQTSWTTRSPSLSALVAMFNWLYDESARSRMTITAGGVASPQSADTRSKSFQSADSWKMIQSSLKQGCVKPFLISHAHECERWKWALLNETSRRLRQTSEVVLLCRMRQHEAQTASHLFLSSEN